MWEEGTMYYMQDARIYGRHLVSKIERSEMTTSQVVVIITAATCHYMYGTDANKFSDYFLGELGVSNLPS